MRKLSFISIAALVFLSACNSARKPSHENFAKAINLYLGKHGEACTSIGRQFPIDIPTSKPTDQYGLGRQMLTLQQAGLVSETNTTAVVHGMLDALRGSMPPQPVRRYQLTEEGQKYFRQVPGTFGQTGGFCYGQKIVDAIVKWTEPTTARADSQAEVVYIYKLLNPASWAERPDVQEVFPDIKATMNRQSKTDEVIGRQLTNKGWCVSGT